MSSPVNFVGNAAHASHPLLAERKKLVARFLAGRLRVRAERLHLPTSSLIDSLSGKVDQAASARS